LLKTLDPGVYVGIFSDSEEACGEFAYKAELYIGSCQILSEDVRAPLEGPVDIGQLKRDFSVQAWE
jgi:hypothetical protein